jgi:hypothetical protein
MANLTPNPLRKILLSVGLLAFVGCLAVVGFVAYRHTYECEVILTITHPAIESLRHNEEMLSQISAIGIRPSPDARVLFEGFAKRFSVIETNDEQSHPRDIQSIAKAGGGDHNELVFVLLTLFRWNGIYAEGVDVYSSPGAAREQDGTKIIRRLVLVPALDLVFDPALSPADQHKGSARALLDRISRVHYDRTTFTTYQCPNSVVRSSLTLWH